MVWQRWKGWSSDGLKPYSKGNVFVEVGDDEVHLSRLSQTRSWNPFITTVVCHVFSMNALYLKLLSLSTWKNKHIIHINSWVFMVYFVLYNLVIYSYILLSWLWFEPHSVIAVPWECKGRFTVDKDPILSSYSHNHNYWEVSVKLFCSNKIFCLNNFCIKDTRELFEKPV